MYKFLFVFFIAILCSCKSHVDSVEAKNPGCPLEIECYDIRLKKNIGKTVKIDDLKGMAVLSLFIKDGTLDHFNIYMFKLTYESDTSFKYRNGSWDHIEIEDYPEQVKYCYPYIKTFVDNIMITPNNDRRCEGIKRYLVRIDIGE